MAGTIERSSRNSASRCRRRRRRSPIMSASCAPGGCCWSPASSASARTASSSPRASSAPACRSRTGQKAARACAINLLAQIKAALGDLDKVVRVVRLGGFINSAPDFLDGPKVMNGASDLMVAVFGDKGRHARTTVGVAVLPLDAAVEVEGCSRWLSARGSRHAAASTG